MKIAFVTTEAPFGNKETYVTTELESISKTCNDLSIFPIIRKGRTKIQSERLKKYCYDKNLSQEILILPKIYFLNFGRIHSTLFKLWKQKKLKRIIYSLIFLSQALALADWVKSKNIKHIHAYWGTTTASVAMIASELASVEFSFTIHRADIFADDALAYKTEKAKFVRSISHWGKNIATKLGAKESKINVVHLGVEIPKKIKKQKSVSAHRLVTACDLIPSKRIIDLVDEVSKLPKVSLSIYGDGPEKRRIAKLIRKQSLGNRIFLLGRIQNHDLLKHYSRGEFNFAVMPSSIEGISVALMEAMAHRIPVAALPVGGNGELINRSNSFFLENNLGNLSTILSKTVDSKMIDTAQKTVMRNFDSNKNSLKLLKLINS